MPTGLLPPKARPGRCFGGDVYFDFPCGTRSCVRLIFGADGAFESLSYSQLSSSFNLQGIKVYA